MVGIAGPPFSGFVYSTVTPSYGLPSVSSASAFRAAYVLSNL